MRRANTLKLGDDRALYVGELPATGWHQHAAPVLLVGLSGRFALHLADGRSERCESAILDSGVEHVFDPSGERVALLYLEPDARETRWLRTGALARAPVAFDPLAGLPRTRALEERLARFDLPGLQPPIPSAEAAPGLDPRVQDSLRHLRGVGEGALDRAVVAEAVALSPSRFNHLFRREAGVSFRSYRLWSQVRRAIAAFRPDGSLTHAALEGAFCDSAHFSHIFQRTFGMTPSSVLRPLREVTLLPRGTSPER